jgi:uncharacterized protein YlzI (FlbEa/FlbD family)
VSGLVNGCEKFVVKEYTDNVIELIEEFLRNN